MKEYTQEEIDKALSEIESMTQYEMCKLWRFHHPADESIYFRNDLPTGKAFNDRLFKHFGGFTPAISIQVGWEN